MKKRKYILKDRLKSNTSNVLPENIYELVPEEKELGYIAENEVNKATDFSVIDNVKYPTTQAVEDRFSAQQLTVREELDDNYTVVNSDVNTLLITEGNTLNNDRQYIKIALNSIERIGDSVYFEYTGAGTIRFEVVDELTTEIVTFIADSPIGGKNSTTCITKIGVGKYKLIGQLNAYVMPS